MTRTRHWLAAQFFWLNLAVAHGGIPTPAEMPMEIVVSGRTSTAINIKIVKTGQNIPVTYAGELMKNTSGFEWYVSKHYALKSQMDEKFSRMMLEISELALPHWEELTGLKPPHSATMRMCIVYAKSMEELRRAARTDLGIPYNGGGGGVTLWANHTSYDYPSGTLQYQLKDLVIHENLHMLQGVALKHNMGTEGFTYAGSQYVYDSNKKQLTVMVFDQAPINHHTDQGIAALQKDFISIQNMAKNHWNEGGPYGSVYSFFFWSDPDRWFKWQIWRDEFYKDKVNNETNISVMESIFGPLDKLNSVWEKWVQERRITFHHVDWGWEQNGNTITAYGFPWDKHFWSQMNIQYAPKEKVEYDPLRMDYPAESMPAILGPIKRGVEEPSVGFVISGVSGPCWGGFGLGVDGRKMCQVILAGDAHLVIEGKEMAVDRKVFPLTEEIKNAAKNDHGRYGVTIQIKKDALEVTIRAGNNGQTAIKEMKASVPISADVREQLMSKYMAMIGKDGYPAFIPFFDDARRIEPDLTKLAPANRWRFPEEKALSQLYRWEWQLKEKAPASLIRLKKAMLETVDKEPAIQRRATFIYKENIRQVMQDIKKIQDPHIE